jgi:TolA-binding protein
MSNRVEELESQVAELQAAVDGLTEELVETRERLRQLESEHGVDETGDADRQTVDPDAGADADADVEADSEADAEDASGDAESDADDGSTDSEGSDIIVA